MIVDTSALIAIASGEPEWERLRHAINSTDAFIPAPALTEFHLVINGKNPSLNAIGSELVATMLADGVQVVAFTHRHAEITATARERYGKGNGTGGLLNFGDLMVYAVAKDRNEPLLFTGRDFTSTDLQLHPASRLEP